MQAAVLSLKAEGVSRGEASDRSRIRHGVLAEVKAVAKGAARSAGAANTVVSAGGVEEQSD